MKAKITVIHVEPIGKSGDYAKIYGVTSDTKFPSLTTSIVHKSALPVSAHVGTDISGVIYYGKSGLVFEPFCDTILEEGGVSEWVKEQLL